MLPPAQLCYHSTDACRGGAECDGRQVRPPGGLNQSHMSCTKEFNEMNNCSLTHSELCLQNPHQRSSTWLMVVSIAMFIVGVYLSFRLYKRSAFAIRWWGPWATLGIPGVGFVLLGIALLVLSAISVARIDTESAYTSADNLEICVDETDDSCNRYEYTEFSGAPSCGLLGQRARQMIYLYPPGYVFMPSVVLLVLGCLTTLPMVIFMVRLLVKCFRR